MTQEAKSKDEQLALDVRRVLELDDRNGNDSPMAAIIRQLWNARADDRTKELIDALPEREAKCTCKGGGVGWTPCAVCQKRIDGMTPKVPWQSRAQSQRPVAGDAARTALQELPAGDIYRRDLIVRKDAIEAVRKALATQQQGVSEDEVADEIYDAYGEETGNELPSRICEAIARLLLTHFRIVRATA